MINKRHLKNHATSLSLHVAVKHYPGCVSISVLQGSVCTATGEPKSCRKLVGKDCKVTQRVIPQTQAEPIAIQRALLMAKETIWERSYAQRTLGKITVYSFLPEVLEVINRCVEDNAGNAIILKEKKKHIGDGLWVKRILKQYRELSRAGVDVIFALASKEDKAAVKAMGMAKQRGRQSCRDRRVAREGEQRKDGI